MPSILGIGFHLACPVCLILNLFLSPFVADRAILWSNCEENKIKLEEMGMCNIPRVDDVHFQRWSPENQFRNMKTACTNSWIGIEGLPINYWNIQVFKEIGQKCGGLMDVARCTFDFTFLSFAINRLRGKKDGFIPEYMEIDCLGIKVKIKLVSFRERNLRFFGVQKSQVKGELYGICFQRGVL